MNITTKRRIAARYSEALQEVAGIVPLSQAHWADSIFWLFTVLVDRKEFGLDSRALILRLGEAGVQTRPLWQPLHLSEAHSQSQFYGGTVAEEIYRDAVSLPSSVGLSPSDQEYVIETLVKLGPSPSRSEVRPGGAKIIA